MAWWRYSQYELRGGHICPKPKARFESYDPWADYESSKLRAGESPPYLSLLNLLEEIRGDVRVDKSGQTRSPLKVDSVQAPERAIRRILEWTNHYGLLGILPQRVLLVQNSPVRGPSWRINSARLGGRFEFPFETWKNSVTSRCMVFPNATTAILAILPAEEVLADFDSRSIRIDRRGSTKYPPPPRGASAQAPQTSWFFNTILGPAFWERYCEPLADWFFESENLSSILGLVASINRPAQKLSDETIGRLNLLLSGTAYQLELCPNNKVLRGMQYPSLMAAFAAMVAQDLDAREKRIVTCPECGILAASSAYRRTYCSKRCAWRARKRRQREKEASEGKPVTETQRPSGESAPIQVEE